jgi:hypothetical protein
LEQELEAVVVSLEPVLKTRLLFALAAAAAMPSAAALLWGLGRPIVYRWALIANS